MYEVVITISHEVSDWQHGYEKKKTEVLTDTGAVAIKVTGKTLAGMLRALADEVDPKASSSLDGSINVRPNFTTYGPAVTGTSYNNNHNHVIGYASSSVQAGQPVTINTQGKVTIA